MGNRCGLLSIILGCGLLAVGCKNHEVQVQEPPPVVESYQIPSDNPFTEDSLNYDYFIRRKLYIKRAALQRITEMRDLMWIEGIDSCSTYNWKRIYDSKKQDPVI